MTEPRGIRNNNPLNIVHNDILWGGLDYPPDDGRFCRFTDPVFGIRAACKILLTYQNKYRLRTVREIVNRWAPPHENDTESYIAAVARQVGVGRDEAVDLSDPATMRPMLKAMIRQECGKQPYSDGVLSRAMELAGVRVATQGGKA